MICFIFNPNSGNKSNRFRQEILENLKKIPDSRLYITEHPGHAKEIVQDLRTKNDIFRIIAIGGDGTVNEIGSTLQGTHIELGIIPMGSGNGLARHLGISMKFNQALQTALHGTPIPIDTLSWNEHTFFCTGGIGFDAEVAAEFAKGNERGLMNYIRATFKTIRKYHETIIGNLNKPSEALFSLTIANANQYGNNAYISPNSNLQDAQFEVVKIKNGNIWQLGQLGISLFLKRIHKHSNVEISSTNNFEFTVPRGTAFHLDGESLKTEDEHIKIKIFSKNLNVVV